MTEPADPYPSLETMNFVLSAVAHRVRATAYRSDPYPGGPVMCVASNHPERIASLLLVAGTGDYEEDCDLLFQVSQAIGEYLDGQAVQVGIRLHWEGRR